MRSSVYRINLDKSQFDFLLYLTLAEVNCWYLSKPTQQV